MKGSRLKLWTIFALFTFLGVCIVTTAAHTMFFKARYWQVVKDKYRKDSLVLPARRGNILSSDGEIMVTSVPEYYIRMDFVAQNADSDARQEEQRRRDSTLDVYIDSIAIGLANIFPDKSATWFKNTIRSGQKAGSRSCRLYPKLVTYVQYQDCKKLPFFREGANRSGFYGEEKMLRKKLYASLASRTLGNVSQESDSATSGIEKCYDAILRGKNGYAHSKKIRNRRERFVDVEPVNGHDIVSTIDVRMQDIAERALLDKLSENELRETAERAVVILMEVATGDIKAIVNMAKVNGQFKESTNDAINALWEPGSTFKTGSIMVAMEDGFITPETVMNCEGGVYTMHGRAMRDHNWRNNGYRDLTVSQILENSSNIGVSKIIDTYYGNNPQKYVQGLNKIGVGIPLNLPMGADPKVRMPKEDWKKDANWSKTALAWMSIGYEVQLTPLNTLTFYNAIANNGKMVRPRFVKAEMENGRVIKDFPVEVIKEKICSQQTLDNIHTILEKVVSEGLGRKAGNKKFKVSGKTGTAQVAENGSYSSHKYMVSFCGYFPSDEPKYSCIVCIYKRGTPASGGSQCGPVFSQISQLIMSQGNVQVASVAGDPSVSVLPQLADGNIKETCKLLDMMNISYYQEQEENDCVWGDIDIDTLTSQLSVRGVELASNTVPDVTGMGARDAVYALQEAGMSVRLSGNGKVISQSVAAGTKNVRGGTIVLSLE